MGRRSRKWTERARERGGRQTQGEEDEKSRNDEEVKEKNSRVLWSHGAEDDGCGQDRHLVVWLASPEDEDGGHTEDNATQGSGVREEDEDWEPRDDLRSHIPLDVLCVCDERTGKLRRLTSPSPPLCVSDALSLTSSPFCWARHTRILCLISSCFAGNRRDHGSRDTM